MPLSESRNMKTITFIAITLLAGAIAGAMLAIINQGIVQPFIEQAIALENERAAAEGEMITHIEFDNYRIWQRIGQIAAGTILGTSIGALFGLVFAYSRSSIAASGNVKKALILAGVMWLVLFIVPALKYPANPPAVGNPDTIYYRQSLYIAYLAISGLTALGAALLYRKLGNRQVRKALIPAIYAGIIIAAYLTMPANPDAITAPMDLVAGFRIASGFTMSIFWLLLGVILGGFWDKFKPHEIVKVSM
jgi:predicted cobalt transporter CbtA